MEGIDEGLNGYSTIAYNITIIGIMIIIGYLCQKTNYVEGIDEKVSKIIKNITLPLLIITSFKGEFLTGKTIQDGVFIIFIAFIVITLLLCLGILTAKIFKLKESDKKLHICLSAFGNVIFLGYPLIFSLFGQIGLMYAVFYALVNELLVYTFGIYFLSGKGRVKDILNPNTVSFIIGILMVFLSIDFPDPIREAFSKIGSTTTPLSMLFIGSTLAKTDIRYVFKRYSIFVICLIKMILIPILTVYILSITNLSNFISFNAIKVLAIQIAMPAQTIFAILAKEYNVNPKYGAECIFISTVLSLFTLPFVYKIIQII